MRFKVRNRDGDGRDDGDGEARRRVFRKRRARFCAGRIRRPELLPRHKARRACRAVVLHLCLRYVSKAAIFRVPALSRAGLKIEVPLDFQGLGSLGAATCGDDFSLASLPAKRARLWLL